MRLFLAINLPEDVRREIADATAALRAAAPSVAWTDAAKLHLTLKFLGEQPQDAVARLVDALRQTASSHAAPTIELGGLGAFPSRRQPRVVWLGVAADPRLELLHHDVEIACARLGYDVEGRAFRPHVTLGRVRPSRGGASQRGGRAEAEVDKGAAAALAAAAREVQSRWAVVVSSVDLMESVLASSGARHVLVAGAPLAAN